MHPKTYLNVDYLARQQSHFIFFIHWTFVNNSFMRPTLKPFLIWKTNDCKHSDLKPFFPKEHTAELHLHTTEQKSTQPNLNTQPSIVHTTELTKQNAASWIHDPRTCPNLRFHKIYRHCVRYFSLWIMSHRQNQLEWKNRRDTDRSRLLCRPPFSLKTNTPRSRDAQWCVFALLGCVQVG